jgi:hypothetical protein
MTRREILKSAASALPAMALPPAARSAPQTVLKNMGSAGPGLGARIRATRDAGKEWDIVEYCHEKGLGAAHTSLPRDLDPAALAKGDALAISGPGTCRCRKPDFSSIHWPGYAASVRH